MSEIEKAKDLIAQFKGIDSTSSKFFSMKLLVLVGSGLGMVWLAKANFALILWNLTILIGLWLTCHTVQETVLGMKKLEIKKVIVEAALKDGEITESELKVIDAATR